MIRPARDFRMVDRIITAGARREDRRKRLSYLVSVSCNQVGQALSPAFLKSVSGLKERVMITMSGRGLFQERAGKKLGISHHQCQARRRGPHSLNVAFLSDTAAGGSVSDTCDLRPVGGIQAVASAGQPVGMVTALQGPLRMHPQLYAAA